MKHSTAEHAAGSCYGNMLQGTHTIPETTVHGHGVQTYLGSNGPHCRVFRPGHDTGPRTNGPRGLRVPLPVPVPFPQAKRRAGAKNE